MNDTKHETNQNASHTPGPWVVDEAPSGQICITAERAWICGQIHNQDDMPLDEANANARLIAASPKLLAFAEAIRNACGVQANLCSTASDEDRTQFIHSIYALWNDHGLIAVDEAKGLAA